MMKVAVTKMAEQPVTVDAIEVSPGAFQRAYNAPLVHQVVVAIMNSFRAGTKAQRTRSEVRGGGKKPWRQKGTGQARAGTIRSPLWRGGGKIFAAKPRDYTQKINKKMYKGALAAVLSELLRQDRLVIVEQFEVAQPKTKVLVEQMKSFNARRVLIVKDYLDENLYLASRNNPNIGVMEAVDVNPVDLIRFDRVVMTVPALRMIEEIVV